MAKIVKSALLILCCLIAARVSSQNNLRLFSQDGKLFKVYLNDKVCNTKAEASVVINNLKTDTLYLKVEFEGQPRTGITVFLLDKGRPVSGKEFNYRLGWRDGKLKVSFSTMVDAVTVPEPLVPKAGGAR